MIANDFKIDFKNKLIYRNPRGSKRSYSVKKLYVYLQDVFDEPKNMKYDIPMEAVNQNQFKLINGWKIR